MAHVQKIKQGAVAPLVAHYERKPELERGYVRGNIDPERTRLNYNLRPTDVRQEVGLAIAQHEQTSGKGIRKDANVLFDWVVTLPPDCPPERSREFFESVAEFMEGRYGRGNVLGCYVHMDETTPHAHIPVLPMRDGKLVASKVVDRRDLQTFHRDLGRHVDAALGMHVSIELGEERKGDKQLSHLGQDEYIVAKRRLESLQRDEIELGEQVEALQPLAEGIPESAGALWEARGDAERERVLAGEVEGLRERLRVSQEEEGRLRGEVAELGGRVERAEGRLEKARSALRSALARLGEAPAWLSRWGREIAEGLGLRVRDERVRDDGPMGLGEVARHVRDDASELGGFEQGRGFGDLSR